MWRQTGLGEKELKKRSYKPDELIGKDVYDAKLKKIGSVSRVELSLIVGNESIPIEKIADAGDIIQLKDEYGGPQESPQSKPAVSSETHGACPKCGKINEEWVKFCLKCGYKF